jgi:hypothetical protein
MHRIQYENLKWGVIQAGYAEEIGWAETVKPPKTPEDLWREYAWVVLNSGMRNQVAEGIWAKVRPAVEAGRSAHTVFGHKGKAGAIDWGWKLRELRLRDFKSIPAVPEVQVEWCGQLPWIGPITKWHLAKNLGVDCAKPDRWLERVAEVAGETVADLCTRLSKETGDRVATVDLVIWRACNLGLHVP